MDRTGIRHPAVETAKAYRATGNTRAVRATVALALEALPCACGRPRWHVASTDGRRTRYIQCLSCGRRDKWIGPEGEGPA